MSREKDYIGPDPVKWLERLIDVAATSQFKPEHKRLIQQRLEGVIAELTKEAQ